MVKHASAPTEFTPTSFSSSNTTRASACEDDTAQPPLTSGFGSVMEREQHIRRSTDAELGRDNGPQSIVIDRLLRQQQMLLDANLALLAQRYEMLPHPTRFASLRTGADRPSRTATVQNTAGWLSSLVAQHLNLRRAIEALIAQRPDGQRGELILAEVARNHDQMALMLTALIKEDAVRDAVPFPVMALNRISPDARASEVNWENEGGAPSGED